ncbi:MAG TPA: ATP-grasp domain-containing protein [Thermoanaerobaculia bacterium]|nr:ATP-grasp domain-containing protein [Thermoanaerobaculia bacterium]
MKRVLVLFPEEWDVEAWRAPAIASRFRFFHEGFDLFRSPQNLALATFDACRFLDRLERKYRRIGLDAVLSNHELWGVLLAAELAERLGLPGHAPEAVIATQHKYASRRLLEQHMPEVTPRFAAFRHDVASPAAIDLPFPFLVKPVKGTFSILARPVASFEELRRHLSFGRFERYLLKRLIDPFEQLVRGRLALPVSAYEFLGEELVAGVQVNVDGYVSWGRVHTLGVVDALMYPGTLAFERFELPSQLPEEAQIRLREVAEAAVRALGLGHGFFNVELLWQPETGAVTLIEVNPRLAYQLADLYARVAGLDLHAAQLSLAIGEEAEVVPRPGPYKAAASFVYRRFDGRAPERWPEPSALARLRQSDPDAHLRLYLKRGAQLAREQRWLGSYRYAVLNLGGRDREQLFARRDEIAARLGLDGQGP